MGKKERAEAAHKQKEQKKLEQQTSAAQNDTTLPVLAVMVVVSIGLVIFSNVVFQSETEGRAHFLARVLCFVLLESGFTTLFSILLLQPARAGVGLLPGGGEAAASDGPQPWAPTDAETASNEEPPTLLWPHAVDAARLPAEWTRAAVGKKRPYFLNHVRGSTRLVAAAMRVGQAAGSLCNVAVLSLLLDRRPVAALGLVPSATFLGDLGAGVAVGVGLISALTAVELRLGWVRRLGWFEVADPAERFGLNLLIDCTFHAAVALNEELPLRGWLLLNTAEAAAAHFGLGRAASLLCAMAAESVVFASLHAGSPGATRLGLLNLTLGGCAAALNVLLTGSLAFSLGWHWGWNIAMGNLFGRSTSGIPISATLLSVAPHPSKAHLHGGTFGPEGGPLAPVAYVVGMVALYLIYGTSRFGLVHEAFPFLANAA